MIPPQPGYGFQQQLVPGMRPGGGAHMPNYFVPVVQPGQQGLRPGIRRNGPESAQGQQTPQPFQQQMVPRGRVYRYPPGPLTCLRFNRCLGLVLEVWFSHMIWEASLCEMLACHLLLQLEHSHLPLQMLLQSNKERYLAKASIHLLRSLNTNKLPR
eukprot:UN03534